jgi:transposase-like protein
VAEVRGGLHYPRSIGEFQAWFRTDADCLDYLEWLRWPHGFECARCDGVGGWRTGDRRIMCAACGHRTSVTAGTIFDKTRTPLTVWFTACWSFATAKDGISALSLQRSLEIGSYQTAWAMLARFRSVLVHPGRKRLNGTVEVDETYIGGEEPGLAGGRAQGKKVLTGIAVEVSEPKGIGRCRMALLEDGSAASLLPFVADHVAPAATVITDAWMGYHGLAKLGYAHQRRSQRAARARGEDPATLLPAVHRVASLAKRWLLSTHQGAVEPAHLQSYLDEFVFRFNRRRSRSRGMVFYRVLELAAGHEPVRYRNITAGNKPRKTSPVPPATRGHPPSLDRVTARDELTPPVHRAPPGQHAGRSPAEGTPARRAFVPGILHFPGFDAIVPPIDASAVVHTRSSSRRTPDPLTAGLFPQRSPPRLLTGAACGGLGSPPARRTRRTYLHHWHSTVHAGDLLHRLTPLSGHTPERRLGEPSPRPPPSLSVISRSAQPTGPTLGWFGVTDPLEAWMSSPGRGAGIAPGPSLTAPAKPSDI